MAGAANIVGNWKMNATVSEAVRMASELRAGLSSLPPKVDVAVCPPFTALHAVRGILEGSGISVGAQDMYHEADGAFTGEISTAMVAELCDYVILGHSERRAHFGETDETVRLKGRRSHSGRREANRVRGRGPGGSARPAMPSPWSRAR